LTTRPGFYSANVVPLQRWTVCANSPLVSLYVLAMKFGKTLYVTNCKGWRAWLMKNHSREKEIRLIYYKKHSGKRSFGDKQGCVRRLIKAKKMT
jgi:hypothetical protein